MTEQDRIFAASMVDQGSSMAIVDRQGKGWSAVIRLRRDSKIMLEDIHRVFGGSLAQAKTGEWYLNYNGHRCTDFLVGVLPYLKIKNRHALIIMQFNDHIRERNGAGRKLTDSELAYRQKLQSELKSLK